MARRPLNPTEIDEARLVFGPGLDYTRARVAENAGFPNLIDRIGQFLMGQPRPAGVDNAVTLGSTSYFPRTLRTTPDVLAAGNFSDMSWLIHELTHQWQYQRFGWRYLSDALRVQLRQGRGGYDYRRNHASKEEALREDRDMGKRLADFNLEQQGDLARDYYVARRRGRDATPWEPFILDLRS